MRLLSTSPIPRLSSLAPHPRLLPAAPASVFAPDVAPADPPARPTLPPRRPAAGPQPRRCSPRPPACESPMTSSQSPQPGKGVTSSRSPRPWQGRVDSSRRNRSPPPARGFRRNLETHPTFIPGWLSSGGVASRRRSPRRVRAALAQRWSHRARSRRLSAPSNRWALRHAWREGREDDALDVTQLRRSSAASSRAQP